MFLTNVLFKAPKSKYVMVILKSTGSNHRMISFRERLEPKKEIIHYDPNIEMDCVYKEFKRLRSAKPNITVTKQHNEHTYGIIPNE